LNNDTDTGDKNNGLYGQTFGGKKSS